MPKLGPDLADAPVTGAVLDLVLKEIAAQLRERDARIAALATQRESSDQLIAHLEERIANLEGGR